MSEFPPLGFVVYRPTKWDDVVRLGRFHGDWVFRGHGDATWRLETSIERTANRYGVSMEDRKGLERKLVERFQRAAHLYFPPTILPQADDWLGWMSVIQHYGGPTRLLDFTESFYCAAFFALEATERPAVIWAVNRRHLEERIARSLSVETKKRRDLDIRTELRDQINEAIEYRKGLRPVVLPFFPNRLHERLAQQQGLFLTAGRVDRFFETQLLEVLGIDPEELTNPKEIRSKVATKPDLDELQNLGVVKIEIGVKQHRKGRAELRRMNLTAQSMYPGSEGYARALHWELGLLQAGEPDFRPMNEGSAKDLAKRLKVGRTKRPAAPKDRRGS